MLSKTFLKLSNHYDNLFERHGDSVKSSQQSDKITRDKRLKILTQNLDLNKKISILDFGCGTGYLLQYLLRKGFNGSYTGIDISEKIINFAKYKNTYKKAQFIKINLLEKSLKKKFDYTLVNGTFNNNTNNNWLWIRKVLKELNKITKKEIVFNNLSEYVDYKEKKLFYIKPEKVFNFCKLNISPYIIIKNDYQIKKGIIRFEFTTFIIKKD